MNLPLTLRRCAPLAVITLLAVAGCSQGTAAEPAMTEREAADKIVDVLCDAYADHGVEASDCPTTEESTETTAAPTTTVATADNLETAHEECTGDSALTEFDARHEQVGDIYQNIFQMMADQESMTRDEVIDSFLAEMYNTDEDTLTIGGAYDNDDEYGMSENGLLAGIVYDCVLSTLEVPTRVVDHIGTTRALDGTQEDSWDDYQARWTYHPDDGVNLTIWTD